jgi:uncharacterized paraquat-inducible protein A
MSERRLRSLPGRHQAECWRCGAKVDPGTRWSLRLPSGLLAELCWDCLLAFSAWWDGARSRRLFDQEAAK